MSLLSIRKEISDCRDMAGWDGQCQVGGALKIVSQTGCFLGGYAGLFE